MRQGGAWKWVNKALQSLIRYQLLPGTQLAVLSWGERPRLEVPLARLEAAGRGRVADAIPGKYQLAGDNRRDLAALLRALPASQLVSNPRTNSVTAQIIILLCCQPCFVPGRAAPGAGYPGRPPLPRRPGRGGAGGGGRAAAQPAPAPPPARPAPAPAGHPGAAVRWHQLSRHNSDTNSHTTGLIDGVRVQRTK